MVNQLFNPLWLSNIGFQRPSYQVQLGNPVPEFRLPNNLSISWAGSLQQNFSSMFPTGPFQGPRAQNTVARATRPNQSNQQQWAGSTAWMPFENIQMTFSDENPAQDRRDQINTRIWFDTSIPWASSPDIAVSQPTRWPQRSGWAQQQTQATWQSWQGMDTQATQWWARPTGGGIQQQQQTTTSPDVAQMDTQPPTTASNARDTFSNIANRLRDRLNNLAANGEAIDSDVRDRVLWEIITEMWGNATALANSQQAREIILGSALLGTTAADWDEYYQKATSAGQRAQMLDGIPTNELAKSLANWTVKLKDLRILRLSNPEKWQEVMDQKNEILKVKWANDMISGKTTTPDESTIAPTISGEQADEDIQDSATTMGIDTSFLPRGTLLEAYDSYMNSPEMKQSRESLNEVSLKVAELQNEKANLFKKLSKKITDSAILEAVYRDQSESLNLELSNYLVQQQTLQAQLSASEANQKERFNIYMKDLELVRNQQMKSMEMQQDMFKQQMDIITSDMPAEIKSYFLDQSIYTQAQMFGLDQQQIQSYMVMKQSLWKMNNVNYEMVKMDDGSIMFYNPKDPMGDNYITWGIWFSPDGAAEWSNFRTSSPITKMWTTEWDFGVDFDGYDGQPIPAPYDGVIENVFTMQDGNIAVNFRTNDGYLIQVNHNNPAALTLIPGQRISAGQTIWYVGKTGNVIPMNWWDGSHADVRVKDPNGQYYTGDKALQFLRFWANQISQNMLSDYKNALQSVQPANLSEWARKEDLAQMNQLIQQGNINIARRKIVQRYTDGLSSQAQETWDIRNNITNHLLNLNNLIQQYKQLWGQNLGPLAGRIKNFERMIGSDLISETESPQLAQILNDIFITASLVKEEFARDQTGAAIAESEERFFNSLFPRNTKDFEYNERDIRSLYQFFTTDMDSRIKQSVTPELFVKIRWQSMYPPFNNAYQQHQIMNQYYGWYGGGWYSGNIPGEGRL